MRDLRLHEEDASFTRSRTWKRKWKQTLFNRRITRCLSLFTFKQIIVSIVIVLLIFLSIRPIIYPYIQIVQPHVNASIASSSMQSFEKAELALNEETEYNVTNNFNSSSNVVSQCQFSDSLSNQKYLEGINDTVIVMTQILNDIGGLKHSLNSLSAYLQAIEQMSYNISIISQEKEIDYSNKLSNIENLYVIKYQSIHSQLMNLSESFEILLENREIHYQRR